MTRSHVLAFVSAITLIACSEGSAFKQSFVRSCSLGGAPKSVCACTYDRVSRQYTDQQMLEFEGSTAGQAREYYGDLIRAMRDCVGE